MSYKKFKETVCSCQKCQNMCKTPCIGTPIEMGAISKSGFRDRLAITGWAAGIALGTHDKIITIVAPLYDEKRDCCTFFKNGKCELHDLGLKPTEGRFADCKQKPLESKEELFETPLYKCIEEWENLKF